MQAKEIATCFKSTALNEMPKCINVWWSRWWSVAAVLAMGELVLHPKHVGKVCKLLYAFFSPTVNWGEGYLLIRVLLRSDITYTVYLTQGKALKFKVIFVIVQK